MAIEINTANINSDTNWEQFSHLLAASLNILHNKYSMETKCGTLSDEIAAQNKIDVLLELTSLLGKALDTLKPI